LCHRRQFQRLKAAVAEKQQGIHFKLQQPDHVHPGGLDIAVGLVLLQQLTGFDLSGPLVKD
jgi:hypothetical protein